MILVCPKCKSKVVTVTGYPLDTVACGNCGTEIRVADREQERPSPPLHAEPSKRNWWRRLFG